MKRTIVLSLVLIFVMLAGCVPAATAPAMPTDLPQAATQAPTKTPEATQTPLPSATPVPPTATKAPPTNTPVPPTATPMPPTATVEPNLTSSLSDAGYGTISPLLPAGLKLGDLLEIKTSESYKKGADQYVHLMTFPLPGQLEASGFGLELQNPNYILTAVVAALKGVGVDAKSELAGIKIADLSKGVTFVTTIAGVKQKMDVVLFQHGTTGTITGAVVIVERPDGTAAGIDVKLVAQMLDKRIAAAK